MPPPTRAFIAYDFALSEGTMFDNTLEDALTSQPPELDIHYPGAHGEPRDQGTIWESMVRREIGLAQKVLAFIDLPNANVGFEIGYAFGSGRHVGVYRFKNTEHRWLKQPPLRGHFRFQASTAEQIHQAFLKDNFIVLKDPPAGGDGVILLCPEASGAPLLRQVDPAWGWATPPLSEWDIVSMPKQFKDAGLVVWIITAHGDGPAERDGTENTALSILAGYAEARPELDLKIFVHKQARPVADVEHVAKRFSTNSELKTLLTAVHEEWQTTLATRKAAAAAVKTAAAAAKAAKPTRKKATKPSSAAAAAAAAPTPTAPPLLCPQGLPPHPHDLFPDTASRFIGREAQLGSGADAVVGMLERFKNPGTRLSGGRAVQWLWAHGYGGMGKSWCLHRIRCIAQQDHPKIRALIIDWDKPDWLAPLQGEPRTPVEIFDLIAIRLCQCLQQTDESAITAYREAKARVAATAAEHRRVHDRFEQHLQLACSGDGAGTGDLIRRLRDESLWHDDPARREPLLKTLRESRLRHREVFSAWCADCGETDPAVICPTRQLAHGLRASLSTAMQQHPLIVVLDTFEIIQEDLDFWLRELFAPLITAAAPLLLLIGSRLRPDLHQPKGSRRGWLTDQLPAAARRIEDFGESLRFPVIEIEQALDQLRRPLAGNHERLAEIMHRVTLGVPLAVRGLLDLHDEGDDALTSLSAPAEDEEPLSEKKAVEKVIADVCERWFYNLEDKPERAEDLQDIIALALLPVLDQGLLRELWQPQTPYARLRDLSRKYSLLTDGDLHPTVRSYLRRHWRAELNRPECLPQVLERLAHAYAQLSTATPPAGNAQRVQHRIATLNLRSWREGDAILPDLARALCLARVYEVEDLTLETLLSELPLTGPTHPEARKLWHRDDTQLPDNEAILPWLISQRAASQTWTAEEDAALSLLQGCAMQDYEAAPAIASAAMDHLERAVAFFGLETLPISAQAGEAYFSIGYSLHPDATHKPCADFASRSAEAFEHAIALHCREAVAWFNVAVAYADHLNQPERAEQSYLRAIELDPKDASPHNALGNLYRDHLNQPERAEQSYFRAIELDPKLARPHDDLGDLCQDHLNQPERAEQSYHRAIELDSKFAFPHNGLGNLYQYHLNQPERAEQSYFRAIELDPKFSTPHHGLGGLYESAGCWPQAVAEFSLGNTLDDSYGGGCRGLAWVALRSGGAVAEAQDWALQAREKKDASHPGNDLLSIALEAWAGDWAPALDRWAGWVRALPPHQDYLVRANHNRIAALLRRVHAAGHLQAWVAVLRPARPCWQPYVLAADAFLQGPQAPAPADPDAATIFRELQTPDLPAAAASTEPATPKRSPRKKP